MHSRSSSGRTDNIPRGCGAAMASKANIRFRLNTGIDCGPMEFDVATTTILMVKERLAAEWPEAAEGDAPSGPGDLKLILSGQILDNGKTLADIKLGGDAVVTMHLVVRMPQTVKSSADNAAGEVEKVGARCNCIIA